MDKKPKVANDDEEQSRRFKETARSLGVDESGKTFARAVGAVMPAKKTHSGKAPKKRARAS